MTRRAWILGIPTAAALCGAEPKGQKPKGKADGRNELKVPYWMTGEGSVEAKLNGAPAKIVGQLGPEDGLLLVLVLDLAGDLAAVQPAREALTANLDKLSPNVWVALMRAQDGLRALVDPGPDRQPVVTAIQDLSISGRAGLLDTVETATVLADHLMDRSKVRVAVLYITDSSIYNYREDFTNPVVNSSDGRDMSRRFPEGLVKEKIRQLETRLGAREAPVFIVHLNYQSDRLNEAYQTGLIALANTTGGNAAFCRSIGEIPSAIDSVFGAITSLRFVTIELKAGNAKQADVVLSAGNGSLKHRTRYLLKGR